MLKLINSAVALAFVLIAGVATADDDRRAIEELLSRYEGALNASDTEAVLALYAEDGVFMPQHSLPHVGHAKIRAAYDEVFAAISLDIAFAIDEIMQPTSDWAFARTRSEGMVTLQASGDELPEANQEVFILAKDGRGDWKIARYIFSTTNAPGR